MQARLGTRVVAAIVATGCAAGTALAQPADTAARPTAGPSEPQVRRIVVEDEAVRIDELRVRGQSQRITVTPKRGGKAYEIVPATSARDPSQPGASPLAGQRVWSVFSF